VRPRLKPSHSASVSGVATRVSSRTALQLCSPVRSASVSAGSADERAGHAELLAQLARAQAEAPVHVLGQRGEAEAAVHGQRLGPQQPARQLQLVGPTRGGQRAEGVVHHGGLVDGGLQLILIGPVRVAHGW
jgi:hypothetical protein